MNDFFEAVFLKEDNTLDKEVQELEKLRRPDTDLLYRKKAGAAGEKQVAYHLKKSGFGMYVLRDINLTIDEFNAQVDFVVITSHHCYFIECKNYSADTIEVDEFSNFIKHVKSGNRSYKEGIPSPLSQADDQLAVFKKICLRDTETIKTILKGVRFNDYFKTVVVFTNPDNKLNLRKTPDDIKYRILKVDNLIRQIEYDKNNSKDGISKIQMEALGYYFLTKNVSKEVSITEKKGSQNILKNIPTSLFDSPLKIIVTIIAILAILGFLVLMGEVKPNFLTQTSGTAVNELSVIKLKNAYEESYNDGFSIIGLKSCLEISNIVENKISCGKNPLIVNFIDDHNVTIFKDSMCYRLTFNSNYSKLDKLSYKYVPNWKEYCDGYPVGYLRFDEDNQYLNEIGGIEKIKEIAAYTYANQGHVDDYIDLNNVEKRGGDPMMRSTYKLRVEQYFAALTGYGKAITSPSTDIDETKKMLEALYYVIK